jgi:hypothetical protein
MICLLEFRGLLGDKMGLLIKNTENFDCSRLSFEEWVALFFNQEVLSDQSINKPYGFVNELRQQYTFFDVGDPERVIEYMTRLFSNFSILSPYSTAQINQGVWTMFGPDFKLHHYLYDPRFSIEDRVNCIRSMYEVYAGFVSQSETEEVESCFYMWWDIIGESFWIRLHHETSSDEFIEILKLKDQEPDRFYDVSRLDSDERAILDAMFETLSNVLQLDDERSQICAVHGLGHLHHPAVRRVVQEYIDKNAYKFEPDDLVWIQKCGEGSVM